MTLRNQHEFKYLQQFVVIVMGLSLAKILDKYISSINSFQILIIFILIMLNTIRFYYGNWMYLQELIELSNQARFSSVQIISNYIIIIIDCLCLMMFGIIEYNYFFHLFEFILFFDAVGFLLIIFYDKSNWNLQWKWTMNNLVTIIILLVLHLFQFALSSNASSQLELLFFSIATVICAVNTVIGFRLSWNRFYIEK